MHKTYAIFTFRARRDVIKSIHLCIVYSVRKLEYFFNPLCCCKHTSVSSSYYRLWEWPTLMSLPPFAISSLIGLAVSAKVRLRQIVILQSSTRSENFFIIYKYLWKLMRQKLLVHLCAWCLVTSQFKILVPHNSNLTI